MVDLRARLFEPSDRYDVDLASRRGLLGGLLQAGLYLVGFAALFALAVLWGVLETGGGPASGSTVAFLAAVLGGGGVGIGMVALAGVDPVDRFWRTPAGRLVTVLAVYAAFWALLGTLDRYALFAGLAFVVGRVTAHLWRVIVARA